MKENGKAAYLDTGTWSAGAIKKLNPLRNCCCSFFKEENYNHIPKDIQYRMMQIIFTVLVITPFWNSNKRISVIRHAYCMRYEF
jgi:hypothetical protein